MKITCPKCKDIHEWNPKTKPNWKDKSKRYRTKCSKKNLQFDVKKEYIIHEDQGKSEKTPSKDNNKSSSKPPQIDSIDAEGVNIKKLLYNWAVKEMLTNGRNTNKAIDILMNPIFIERGVTIDNIYWTSDIPPYKRPDFIRPYQHFAMSLMENSHILWQASRQLAGKSSIAMLANTEDMISKPNTVVGLVAPTVPLAEAIMNKFLFDPWKDENRTIMYNVLKPYFIKQPNMNGFVFKNGSRLEIHSLNVSGSQGRTIDILHIEELDKLGTEQSKRRGLAGIINSLRANKDCRIRICCNNASGIFRLLKQELFHYGLYFPIYVEDPFMGESYSGKHSIINENVIVDKRPSVDKILKRFSEVLVSFEFAESQLYNIDSITDECFNPDKVEIAYNKGMNYQLENEYYIRSTMGIDPGGKLDAFGVSIWSLTNKGNIIMRWCKRFYNASHTAKQQAREIAEQYIKYNCEECQSESSAGSPWSISLIEDYINQLSEGKITFRYRYVNFQGEKKPFDKMNFVYLFKILLDYEVIVLFRRNDEERALQFQIIKYIPNKSESNNNPDDLVECGFHGVWVLLGGMDYIRKLTNKSRTIGITDQGDYI